MASLTRVAQAAWLGSKYALDRPDAEFAVETLQAGGLVVYPTDTLYGLGADASNPGAVERAVSAKARPEAQGISVAVSGLSQIEAWARVGGAARNFIASNLPGPYTVILAPSGSAPPHLVSALGIAFRIPRHPIAALLTRLFGPITATSANRHGGAAPVDVATARAQLGDAVALYLDAGPCELGEPSSVVDFTGDRPKVLRQGGVAPKG